MTDSSQKSPSNQCVLPEYRQFIKSRYEYDNLQLVELEWPPPPTRKVFNLSMIGHQALSYGRGDDEMIRMLIQYGEVGRVIEKRKEVELECLFLLDDRKRKIILIEGAPGAGKSTLAWHICQKWDIGELFQEFRLVVFVQLRDEGIQSARSLADVLPNNAEINMKQVISEVKEHNGKGVLFVLDGWDEFAPELKQKQKSFIKELICGPDQHRLHASTLVITSRSISSGELRRYCTSRVEILGFKQSERTQYFAESLSNDTIVVQTFEDCLKSRPVIEASCYLPLNAAIVVHLFLALDKTLPSTLHGVFLQLVINCIIRHMKRKGREPSRYSTLDELPTKMKEQLSHICAMAYHGVMADKVTFSEDDLKAFDLPSDLSTMSLSLIRGIESLMTTHKLRSYNFLHLSVQELLTAYHISKLPQEEQVKIFNELFGKPRFAAVFRFYAAFTKLQAEGIRQIVSQMMCRRNLLLTLLHCLYEARDTSLCQFVTSGLNGKLHLSGKALSPLDAIAIGYFINQCVAICPIVVNLSKCSLDTYKLELLGKELEVAQMAHKFIIQMDLKSSKIDGSHVQCIAKHFVGPVICKLDLSGNPIQDGEDGLLYLCQTLTSNTSLVELNLSNCNLKITEENGQALCHMLRENRTLESLHMSPLVNTDGFGVRYLSEGISSSSAISKLDLSDNPIQDGEDGLSHLYQTLTTNKSLIELTLCGFTLRVSGRRQGEMAKAITSLNLSGKHITGSTVLMISTLISSSSAINRLDLSNNPIHDGEEGLSELCQALTNNKYIVELNLSNCKLAITEEVGQALSHMLTKNTALNVLTLSNSNMNGVGVRYLSEGISSTSAIKKLDLSGNPIQDGEDGLSHLCQALTTNRSLVELNLVNCQLRITMENGQTLSHMLRENFTLKSLHMSPLVNTNGHGVRYLSEGISSSSAIGKLDLSDNPIQDGEDGLSHLCQALTANTSLEELNLSNCNLRITKENGQSLCDMLKGNITLQSLQISPLVDTNGQGMRYLSEGISSSSAISKLDLSDNPIQDGEDGLSHLCQALQTNKSLVELKLCGFTLRVSGKRQGEMAAAITSLDLSDKHITGSTVLMMSTLISSSSAINRLDLSNNPIQDGEDGLSHLCQALTANTSLEELNLSNCKLKITKENGQSLCDMLKGIITLQSLQISPLVDTNGQGMRYLSEGISSSSAISKLDLSDNPIQDGEDGLSHLCQALQTNKSLIELTLCGFTLRVSGRRQGEMAKAITSLNLSGKHITGSTVLMMSTLISSSSAINRLDLSNNPIQDGEDGLSHLCQALTANTSLEELNLSNCKLKITKENGQSLCDMLKGNITLQSLQISPLVHTIGQGMRYLSEGISSSSAISKLDLSDNPIQDGEDGLSHLYQALQTNKSLVELKLCGFTLRVSGRRQGEMAAAITSLDLSDKHITGSTVLMISTLISSSSAINRLDLSNNPIQDGEDGLSHLCQALTANTSLEELNLSNCKLKITKENGQSLCDMLKGNITLQSLQISPLVDTNGQGMRYLSEGISSSSAISKLDLSDNPIQDGEDGLSHLCQALQTNKSLIELTLCGFTLRVSGRRQGEMAAAITSLDLSDKHITGSTVLMISTLISSSSAINRLDLSNNPIQDGEDGLSHLCQALQTNRSLEELNLSKCNGKITEENCPVLSRMLRSNYTLKVLSLSNTNMNGVSIRYLSEGISSSSAISKLDLSDNQIQDGEDGLSHLCKALTKNKSLIELTLCGFTLRVSGTRQGEMAKAITSLNLSGKHINGSTVLMMSTLISSSSAIRKLDLSDNPIQDGEDGLSHLYQALQTNRSLEELNLSKCNVKITEENCPVLSRMLRSNYTLKVLSLSNTNMNGVSIRYLSEGISSSSAISKLDLSDNPIQDGEDGLSHLCKALQTNRSLEELNLFKCNVKITEENCPVLSRMLRSNYTLKVLSLSNTNMNGVSIRYLSEGISSSSAISKLDLSDNPIQDGEDGLSHLCKALQTNRSLEELNLSKCNVKITEENCPVLSRMLRSNYTLKVLSLSNTNLNGVSIRYLSEGISSSSAISKLDLSNNPIQDGDDGLSHLCQALTINRSLEVLNLSNCKLAITYENGQALSHMLGKNRTLVVLLLSKTKINGFGVRYLSEGISSSSAISKLDLSGNPIQDGVDGLCHLCQALTINRSLEVLNLSNCKLAITDENGQALSHMLRKNRTLVVLLLSKTKINGFGVRYLSEGISSSSAISKLDLSDNPIQDGEDGLSHLCKALTTNRALVELNLSSCSINRCGHILCRFLECNKTLQSLDLSWNDSLLMDADYIASTIGNGSLKLKMSQRRFSWIDKMNLKLLYT